MCVVAVLHWRSTETGGGDVAIIFTTATFIVSGSLTTAVPLLKLPKGNLKANLYRGDAKKI